MMSNSTEYVPQRGDAVWINFNPQAGHEQAGHQPAVVRSPGVYNSKTSLAILCRSRHANTAGNINLYCLFEFLHLSDFLLFAY